MRIAYVSGVWDLFHIGHLRMLQRSRTLCDFLVVGVAEDKYVEEYKEYLPIISLAERMEIVVAFRCVDAVMSYWGPGDLRPMERYGATTRIVGPEFGRYPAQQVARTEMRKLGIKLMVLPRTPGVSTSAIKEKCHAETEELAGR